MAAVTEPPAAPEIDRLAARVFLVDPDGSVLLLRGRDPNRPEDGMVVADARGRHRRRRDGGSRGAAARCGRRPGSTIDDAR